jgi:AcrR family transcriptional regulator
MHPGRVRHHPEARAHGGTKRRDRRVERTHRTLRDALVALILERGWDAISVLDVCERADVGRSTFYAHFADKEELLLSGMGDFGESLRALVAAEAREPLGFTLPLVEHVQEYEPVFRALLGKRTAPALHRAFIDAVVHLLQDDFAAAATAGPARDAAVRYVAGALWELLRWWLDQRDRPPAAEVAAIFTRLTTAVLQDLRASASTSSTDH